jgi:hypothetical protein
MTVEEIEDKNFNKYGLGIKGGSQMGVNKLI